MVRFLLNLAETRIFFNSGRPWVWRVEKYPCFCYINLKMIKFDVITIFPEIFSSYLKESLIARAQSKKLIKINIHDLRDWTKDSHKTVDDRPFGGGLGMVLKVEPIFKAVKKLKKAKKSKVILFTPRGKKFNQ